MKKVFIVTGEHSGDMHAAYVAKSLKRAVPYVEIEAIGGENLKNEGIKLFSDLGKMGVVGLGAFSSLFHHYKLGMDLVKYLKEDFKPDLVLLVDYGGFNIRLAEALKKNGFTVFYYISPQVWASRKGRISKIKKSVDKMLTIFPFEEELYKKEGVNATYVGHPLIFQLPYGFYRPGFDRDHGIEPDKKLVGIFPGSRKMEINCLLPIFIKAAQLIAQKEKNTVFYLGQASNVDDDMINKYLKKYDKQGVIKVLKNANHSLLANSDAIMVASGTITLEAALYKTPMVVSYKGPDFLYPVYLLLRYLKFISLPNILAGKEVVKEYLQYNAKPEKIANEIISLLNDIDKKQKMIEEFRLIRDNFGNNVASVEVVKKICEYLYDTKRFSP